MSRIRWMVLGMILAGATAALAQIAISQLPSAGVPLSGGEVVSGVQAGSTVKIPAYSLLTPYFSLTNGYPQILTQGLVVGSPTGGNKGIGTVNAASAYYVNGNALAAAGFQNVSVVTAAGGITAGTTPIAIYVNKTVPATTTVTLPAASNFPGCPANANACPVYYVKDLAANSGTYPITVVSADTAVFVAGNTSATSYVIQSNGAANRFVLTGTSWSVE